jgi:hypothetical protein
MAVLNQCKARDNGCDGSFDYLLTTRLGTRREAVTAGDGELEVMVISIDLHGERRKVFAICAMSFGDAEGQQAGA